MHKPRYVSASIEFGLRVHKVTAKIGKTHLAILVGPDVNRKTILTITGGEGYTLAHLPNNILERVLEACRPKLTPSDYQHMLYLIAEIKAGMPEEQVHARARIDNPLTSAGRSSQV